MTTMHPFWKALWKAEYGLAAVGAGLSLAAIMMVTVLSVLGRYILHTDLIPGAYNMIERVLFPLMVFWALPLAHREGMFPKLELFMGSRMSIRQRGIVALFVGLVELAVYTVLLYFTWLFVSKAIADHRTVMVGVEVWPLWPIAIMMPVSFALMMLEMGRLIVRDILVIATGRETWMDPLSRSPTDVM